MLRYKQFSKENEGGDKMVLDLKRLRAERIACGITQDEMANLMGWKTRTPYAKRENGLVDIGANEFIKMAKILGYETNNLDIFLPTTFPKKNKKLKEDTMEQTANYRIYVEENECNGYVIYANSMSEVYELIKKVDRFTEIKISPSEKKGVK